MWELKAVQYMLVLLMNAPVRRVVTTPLGLMSRMMGCMHVPLFNVHVALVLREGVKMITTHPLLRQRGVWSRAVVEGGGEGRWHPKAPVTP